MLFPCSFDLKILIRLVDIGRLRILLCAISVIVILWLLATSTHDNYTLTVDEAEDMEDSTPERVYADIPSRSFGQLPRELISAEAEQILRERHQRR